MKLWKIILKELGFNIKKTARGIRGIPAYRKNYAAIRKQARHSQIDFPFATPFPCLADRYDQPGVARGHYFHQDLLVAQKIFARNPDKHVDIGSRIDGFVSHVASFREIEVFDIRSLDTVVDGIVFRQMDLMNPPEKHIGYTKSLSCLHTLEHLGLGRYGDPIDFSGHIKGLDNLYKILQPGGTLYLSVPIGEQRINFDAHRVFSVQTLVELFEGRFEIRSVSYVDDRGDLHKHVKLSEQDKKTSFGCQFGCGIFELEKFRGH